MWVSLPRAELSRLGNLSDLQLPVLDMNTEECSVGSPHLGPVLSMCVQQKRPEICDPADNLYKAFFPCWRKHASSNGHTLYVIAKFLKLVPRILNKQKLLKFRERIETEMIFFKENKRNKSLSIWAPPRQEPVSKMALRLRLLWRRARSKLHGMKSALPMETLKLIYLAFVRQEVHYSVQDRGKWQFSDWEYLSRSMVIEQSQHQRQGW